jgi:hypothetical protein
MEGQPGTIYVSNVLLVSIGVLRGPFNTRTRLPGADVMQTLAFQWMR